MGDVPLERRGWCRASLRLTRPEAADGKGGGARPDLELLSRAPRHVHAQPNMRGAGSGSRVAGHVLNQQLWSIFGAYSRRVQLRARPRHLDACSGLGPARSVDVGLVGPNRQYTPVPRVHSGREGGGGILACLEDTRPGSGSAPSWSLEDTRPGSGSAPSWPVPGVSRTRMMSHHRPWT